MQQEKIKYDCFFDRYQSLIVNKSLVCLLIEVPCFEVCGSRGGSPFGCAGRDEVRYVGPVGEGILQFGNCLEVGIMQLLDL